MTGDMGEMFNAMRGRNKIWRAHNMRHADPTGWTQHTAYHWSSDLCGYRIDYWPSRRKWRWKGRTYSGNVTAFIAKREGLT